MSYSFGKSIVTDGLVFYVDAANSKSYPGTGTTWSDLVGSNDGTLTNGPTYSSVNGGSIAFDGVNDYVDTSFRPSGYGEISISAWFKTSSTSYAALLGSYSGYDATNSNGFGVSLNRGSTIPQTNAIHYFGRVGTGQSNDQQSYITGTNLTDGNWHHLTITHKLSTGTVTMYFDGVSQSVTNTAATTSGPWGSFEFDTFLAATNNQGSGATAQMNGSISCMSFYDRVLTASEAIQNYNALKNRFV